MFGEGGIREKERESVCVSVCAHTYVCAGRMCDLICMLKNLRKETPNGGRKVLVRCYNWMLILKQRSFDAAFLELKIDKNGHMGNGM